MESKERMERRRHSVCRVTGILISLGGSSSASHSQRDPRARWQKQVEPRQLKSLQNSGASLCPRAGRDITPRPPPAVGGPSGRFRDRGQKYEVSTTSIKKWLANARKPQAESFGATGAGPALPAPASLRKTPQALSRPIRVQERSASQETSALTERIYIHLNEELVIEFPVGIDPTAMAAIVRALRE